MVTEQDQEWGVVCPNTGRLVSVGFSATRGLLQRYDDLTLRVHCVECKEKHQAFVGDLIPMLRVSVNEEKLYGT